MKTLIKNAMIVDGSREKAFAADLLVEEDIIKEVGSIHLTKDMEVIDAKGLFCAPGFIDTHSHSDLKVLEDPRVLPKVMQGITTEVLGQDGVSMAPLPKQYISAWRKNLAGLDGESDRINWEYETTKRYLSLIEEAGPIINESYLVPHGNIRMEAMGLDDREPTKEEVKAMCGITRREMEAGCLGLSSGLIYMPCAYSKTEEIIELCKVVAEYDGVFAVHQRSEADTILLSMQEVIRIGKESGVKIHFSHFKVCGADNWDNMGGMLALLDQAKEEGLTVSFDQYPYVAGSTMLGVILPPWAHDGGTDCLIERLKDKQLRKRMTADIERGIEGWDNFVRFAGLDGIYITSVSKPENEKFIGHNLTELGEMQGKDPYDAVFDLLLDEKNAVGMVDFYGTEDHVKCFMCREEMNLCTDGLLGGKPHPRAYGAFPRMLGKYVREEQTLSLEDAVYKMSHKAAAALGIEKRGLIKEGYYADLVLFDPDTIIDKSTYTEPIQYPEGIKKVFVNGRLVVDHQNLTGNFAGQVIRRKC